MLRCPDRHWAAPLQAVIGTIAKIIFLTSILGLLNVSSAFALDPSKRVSHYGHTAWRVQDGLFPGAPTVIAQTRDGYIWIGTLNGLVRFDGVRLVPFGVSSGESLRSPVINSLFGDLDGSLWIGTGADLEHWQDGQLTHFPREPGFDFGYIQSISRSREGFIWITREAAYHDALGPVCSVKGMALRCFNENDGIELAGAMDALEDKDGSLWFHDQTSLVHWDPMNRRTLPGGLPHVGDYRSFERMILDTDGTVLMALAQSGSRPGLARNRNGQLEAFKAGSLDGYRIEATAVLRDSKGSLWVGTQGGGLYRVNGALVDHYGRADGLTNDTVDFLLEDREGNIWATTKEGVDCFRDLLVTTYSVHEGLSGSNAGAVLAASDGGVWINNFQSLDLLHPDGTVTSFRANRELPGHVVAAMLEDRQRRLWVGVDSDLYIFDGRTFTRQRKADGQPTGTIKSMVLDPEGNVWAISVAPAPLGTLLHFAGDTLKEEIPHEKLPLAPPYYLSADPGGGVWLNVEGDRLAHWNHDQAEMVALHLAPAPFLTARITGLLARPGYMIASSTAGLMIIRNGQVRTLSNAQGLPCSRVWAMTDTDEALWLSAECGAVELRHSELERWWIDAAARPRTRVLSSLDGMQPAISANVPRASHSADGRIWFANDAVLQMIDPRAILTPAPLAPVQVEQLTADGKTYALSREVVLPPLTRNVQLDYTSPSFATPQRVHFRYKLDGYDDRWVDSGSRRQAFFTNLRPGVYRFRVTAWQYNLPASTTESTISFHVLPKFYQTTWFTLLCVTCGLLAAFLLFRIRIEAVKRDLRVRLQARMDERERIARDLHDTLFQNVQGLFLTIDNSTNTLPEGHPTRNALKNALERSDRVMAESRERVLELRAAGTDHRSLAQELSGVGNDLARGPGPAPGFRVVELGVPESLHPVIFEEVFHICREGLFNAFHHSCASQVEVELVFARDTFSVRITDNGIGIDDRVLSEGGRPGHFGLQGMMERARKIGARFTIRRWPEGGTELELSIPRAVACGSQRHARWWPLRGA